MIKLQSVGKIYNVTTNEKILKDVSIDFEDNMITTILGPSGSGKTTLINIASCLDSNYLGKLIIDNEQMSGKSQKQLTKFRSQKVGFVFQKYHLIDTLTVFENVEIGLTLDKMMSKQKKSELVISSLKDVGLEKFAKVYPNELSGGQQQRVAIARAIVKRPQYLICDEPTGALDSKSAENIAELLVNLNNQYSTTILIVTHNENFVKISDNIVYIKSGEICKTQANLEKIHPKEITW